MEDKDWERIPIPQDIRLVVADMDGTLLDAESEIPESFWPMLDKLEERNIPFVPASGRQLNTLEQMFGDRSEHMSFIAENGNVVTYNGDVIAVHGVDSQLALRIVEEVNAANNSGKYNMGLVICGLLSAYVERTDEPFLNECSKYYKALTIVDDLHEVADSIGDTILKLAIFDFGDAESMAHDILESFYENYSVVVSGKHWVDIMDKNADKSRGVEQLQKTLSITPEQTAVFGDYLNDEGMMSHAQFSFAMGNAHQQVKEAAHYVAPSNTEDGVMRVVDRLVG